MEDKDLDNSEKVSSEVVLTEPPETIIDVLVQQMDVNTLVTDDVQKRNLMNVLTIMQAGHLLDIFKMQSAMSKYMSLAITQLYNADKIISGEETEADMTHKVANAMSFMQKYMVYAQRFTQGNQELLVPQDRREKEDAVAKMLASLHGEELDDVIGLLEGLRNGESTEQFEKRTKPTENGKE